MKVLSKILHVIDNNVHYDRTTQLTQYDSLSDIEIYGFLSAISFLICQKHQKQQSKMNWLVRKIFGKAKKAKDLQTKIHKKLQKLQSIAFAKSSLGKFQSEAPEALVDLMYESCSLYELFQLECVDKKNEKFIIKRAQKFGYQGKEYKEAVDYLKGLMKEIVELRLKNIFTEKHGIIIPLKRNQTFLEWSTNLDNMDRWLSNPKDMSYNEIIQIISNEKLYKSDFSHFAKMLVKKLKERSKTIDKENHIDTKIDKKILYMAMSRGYAEIVEYIISKKDKIDLQEVFPFVPYDVLVLCFPNAPREHLNISILDAIMYKPRTQEGIKFIFEKLKAQNEWNEKIINSQSVLYKRSLLHCAVLSENDEIVQKIIECENVNINIKDFEGKTPLDYAIQQGSIEIVKKLIQAGAKIEGYTTKEGKNGIFYAIEQENVEILKLITNNFPQEFLCLRAPIGFTPLSYAMALGKFDAVRILIKKGCLHSKEKEKEEIDDNIKKTLYEKRMYNRGVHEQKKWDLFIKTPPLTKQYILSALLSSDIQRDVDRNYFLIQKNDLDEIARAFPLKRFDR